MRHLLALALAIALAPAAVNCHAATFDFLPYQTYWPGSWPEAVAVGDVNGDRRDDVVLGTTFYFDEANDYHLFIYLQQQDGSLATPLKYKYGEFSNRVSVALGDLNEDGAKDIVAGTQGDLFVLLSNGAGGYIERRFVVPDTLQGVADTSYVALTDINFDGHLDIVGQGWSNEATLFYGDGHGEVSSIALLPTDVNGYNDIKVGDVTGDGKPDLIMASGQSFQFYIYPNNGKGGFDAGVGYSTPAEIWWPNALAVGDFDHDGKNEVVLNTPANSPASKLYLYRQDASGGLQATPTMIETADIPNGMLAHDLDRDGREDLVVGHRGWFQIGRYMQGLVGLDTTEVSTPAPFDADSYALAAGDLNEDGCSDVAIADHNSGLVTLYGSGCSKARAANDFDGDGISDLLWHNGTTGESAIWRSGDRSRQQSVVRVVNLDWSIAGVGDFDGDGTADLLWHNDRTGAGAIWKGGDYGSQQAMTSVTNTAWKIHGIGDFDGDGKDDVLWRNMSTGGGAIWRSANYRSQLPVTTITDLRWTVAGIGDFNADGKADLLWRHLTSGQNAVWRSGNFHDQQTIVSVSNLNWQVAGIGDFDGDRKADILWRHPYGHNMIWKAANYLQKEVLQQQPTRWTVGAIGDFDGNGKSDLVWRNALSGENVIWRSASKAILRNLTTVSDQDWQVQD
jgi:hypothetical protein